MIDAVLGPFVQFYVNASMIASELTAHEHNADREDFLSVCIGTHVAKANTGEAAEGEVERGDVGARHGRTTHGAVDVWGLQTFPQLLKPPWCRRFRTWLSSCEGSLFFFTFL